MKNFNALVISFFIICLNTLTVFAQNATAPSEEVPMMHDHGKLYVVVAVVLVIFIGIVTYLVRLERKLGHIEKRVKAGKDN